MGGKSKPDNSAVVNEQKAEAAAAAQKEADRQARLTTGLASIKSAFEGSPVMASSALRLVELQGAADHARRDVRLSGGNAWRSRAGLQQDRERAERATPPSRFPSADEHGNDGGDKDECRHSVNGAILRRQT